ncbi:unnamed protein product [Soboliphyme baturini]|uniref:Serine/threonine-protein phosphatase 2A activator n=1 Tax=Soboliphyme baturini TaxID=241478 RepID=A0A183J4Q9_9BILA|nr:unnamed protein product [Soboliphyme baturini]
MLLSHSAQMKTGPFAEHSNQLWNISSVSTWDKVNSGLMKMYKAEVLGKFPVVQHFLFGNLLTIKPHPAVESESDTNMQHGTRRGRSAFRLELLLLRRSNQCLIANVL